MAGETAKSSAICLRIHPWSRTSHVVGWLTPNGPVGTLVKGAVRPKSFFLGQYDLNYTCEILYYVRSRGDLHALRECVPLQLREPLRTDYRKLLLADHLRAIAQALAPVGPEARGWFDLLSATLDHLAALAPTPEGLVGLLLDYELRALGLAGLAPDFSGYDPARPWSPLSVASGAFVTTEGRAFATADNPANTGFSHAGGAPVLRIPLAVAQGLCHLSDEKNLNVLLDAARVFSVFYSFHLDSVVEGRRSVLRMICNK